MRYTGEFFQLAAARSMVARNFYLYRRPISTETSNFEDIPGVCHHTIKAGSNDSAEYVTETILKTIKKNPDSVIFLTERSKLLIQDTQDINSYRPIDPAHLQSISSLLKISKDRILRPGEGHLCMAITDSTGNLEANNQISLRGAKTKIIDGKTHLHPLLYRKQFSNAIRLSKILTLNQEIELIGQKMVHSKTVVADITAIPLVTSKVSRQQLSKNIASARMIKLYNLCTTVVKIDDIKKITEVEIRSCVEDLRKMASETYGLKAVSDNDLECFLSALACTHAVVKSCFGDTHALEKNQFSDMDTQAVAVYCTMMLIGTDKYYEFAEKINFHDSTSRLVSRQ